MARLDGTRFTFGGEAILVESEFSDRGSSAAFGTPLERPLPGPDQQTDSPGFVPNLYYVQPLTERWTFGLGVSAPFGLVSDYDDDWRGRYHATRSELTVINVNPTFAFEITDTLAVGFGASYQRIDTTLENKIDSFATCVGAGGTIATCTQFHGGPGNSAADSNIEIEGDDDDIVFDASFHWQPAERTAVGAVWRQGGEYNLAGSTEFDLSSSCRQDPFCSGALDTLAGGVQAELDLPDTVTVSASHRLTDRWEAHADIAWTEWSALQNVDIVNSENAARVGRLELEYDDTFRYALGASFDQSERWTWRLGVAFDEAPQTSAPFINPRIPDEDRTWVTFGFNLALSEAATLDFGFAHLFVEDAAIDSTEQGNRLRGEFEASANIFGLQSNWRF